VRHTISSRLYLGKINMENFLKSHSHRALFLLCAAVSVLMVGCKSVAPTAEVAVSKDAVSNAAVAGGAQFAPLEMNSAQDKLARANKAMAVKDYPLARQLAIEAQADAKLAQNKANSANAQQAADALQDDIRVLREELNRASQ
jgi:hypothetical protein